MSSILDDITKEQLQEGRDNFKVGDEVIVHIRVREGDKERIQRFPGIVIAHQGRGINESFRVRRIAFGEGIERQFPVHCPNIEKIEVKRKSKVRRARLYHMRNLKGKRATEVKEVE